MHRHSRRMPSSRRGRFSSKCPTGVTADIRGRRFSYLLGTLTLTLSTLLYLLMWRISAPFWAWALASTLLGLGFTFFSGAVEAWLVDALTATGFTGRLDSVFAKGEIVEGVAMLTGSVAGGYIAQITNLGVPYVVRIVVAGADVRVRVHAHARHRLYAEGREQPVARDQESARGLDPVRPSQSAGAMGDAGQHLRGRRVDIRLLCDAAVPPAVVWRSKGVRCRRARSRDRRRRADRRRPPRAASSSWLRSSNIGAPDGDARWRRCPSLSLDSSRSSGWRSCC